MFKVLKGYEVPSPNYYGLYFNIYELFDKEKNKTVYAIDDIYGEKKGKRVKVLDDEFEEFVYTLKQISKLEFFRLRIRSAEDESHRQKMLAVQFERYNNNKKDLIEEIRSLILQGDILSVKEILDLDDTEEQEAV
jgi:hypothetical protein